MKPDLNTIPEFYRGYIQSVLDADYLDLLSNVYADAITILMIYLKKRQTTLTRKVNGQ